jgi:hypothetical protein
MDQGTAPQMHARAHKKPVIPAYAGIHLLRVTKVNQSPLDSRFRGNDGFILGLQLP